MSNKPRVGEFFMAGNCACAEGAIAAGCRFFAGYPISPSLELSEHMSRRLPQFGGHYLQMEDEIGSIAATLGASNAGLKSMTATAGPGFSLMTENISMGVITETPCVLVNVQRGGSGTGLPSLVEQGNMMQVKGGSGGNYEMIAYAPNSVQEMFDLTVKAFNMAEKYRTPTLVMADHTVTHMTDRFMIPPQEKIEIVERRKRAEKDSNFLASDSSQDFPLMEPAGEDNHVNVNSRAREERECSSIDHDVSEQMIERLVSKIRNHAHEIVEVERYLTEDAKVVVVACGSASRSALRAVKEARSAGRKAGLLRLITPSPFPVKEIEQLNAKKIVVPDINFGQIEHSVREHASCPVVGIRDYAGNLVPPRKIYAALEE
jgi:2-oxoglutarate ferredoxin oxidoreductase subunit alpha